eukprot:5018720-Pyramimonas_sp.AAC.1
MARSIHVINGTPNRGCAHGYQKEVKPQVRVVRLAWCTSILEAQWCPEKSVCEIDGVDTSGESAGESQLSESLDVWHRSGKRSRAQM